MGRGIACCKMHGYLSVCQTNGFVTTHQPFFRGRPWISSSPHKQRDQGIGAGLRAPVAVHRRVEGCAVREHVCRIKMLASLEYPRAAVLQPNLHFAPEYEYPLRDRRAVKGAAKADRTMPQLVAARRKYGRHHHLRRPSGQRDFFLAKDGPAVRGGEQYGLAEVVHVTLPKEDIAFEPGIVGLSDDRLHAGR